MKPKINQKRGNKKNKPGINEIKYRKTIQKSNETKSWFL